MRASRLRRGGKKLPWTGPPEQLVFTPSEGLSTFEAMSMSPKSEKGQTAVVRQFWFSRLVIISRMRKIKKKQMKKNTGEMERENDPKQHRNLKGDF